MVSTSTFAMPGRVVQPAFSSPPQADVVPVPGHHGPRQETSKVLPTAWPNRVVVRKDVELSSIEASSTGLQDSIVCSLLQMLFELPEPLSRPELTDLPELVVSQHPLYVRTPQQLLSRGNPLLFPWQVPSPAESLREQFVPAFVPLQFLVAVATVSPRIDLFDHFLVASLDYSHPLEDLTWNEIPSSLPVYRQPVMNPIWRNRGSACWIVELSPLVIRLVLCCQAFRHPAFVNQALTSPSLLIFVNRVATGLTWMGCHSWSQVSIRRQSAHRASTELLSMRQSSHSFANLVATGLTWMGCHSWSQVSNRRQSAHRASTKLFSKRQRLLAFENPIAMRLFSRDYHSWRLALHHSNSARQASKRRPSMRLRSLVSVHPIETYPTL